MQVIRYSLCCPRSFLHSHRDSCSFAAECALYLLSMSLQPFATLTRILHLSAHAVQRQQAAHVLHVPSLVKRWLWLHFRCCLSDTYFPDGIYDRLWCEFLGILAYDFPVFVYIIGIVFNTYVYSRVIEIVLQEKRTVSLWEQ